MTAQRVRVSVIVNGEPREAVVEPRRLLSDFLRDDLGLTGTHVGCEHGVCGACTVMLDGRSVRSCLLFAVQAEGARILTVEGLASGDEPHPLQRAICDSHGLQCGFCTPGMLMTALELLQSNPHPTEHEVRVALSGNICRCTDYDGIVKAVLSLS
jgi:carbon-monoxide dehydrogenase small subunit